MSMRAAREDWRLADCSILVRICWALRVEGGERTVESIKDIFWCSEADAVWSGARPSCLMDCWQRAARSLRRGGGGGKLVSDLLEVKDSPPREERRAFVEGRGAGRFIDGWGGGGGLGQATG